MLHYRLIDSVSQMEQKIVCPFHKDVNPSMIINLSEGTFYCFGCNASGNAFDFVKLANTKAEDMQVMVKFLKIMKSKEFEDLNVKRFCKKKEAEEREDKAQSLVEAKDYYFNLKTVDWENPATEEEKNSLSYMIDRGFDAKVLNLCKAKSTYNSSYPIIFPMLDNGEFKGWVCRTDKPDIAKKRKYLYNSGFSRRTTLVGDYKKAKKVVVVEGYMDMLKMKMFGIKNVCAILGWKMSEDQIKKLKQEGVEIVISALDNDECGKKGTKYLSKFFKVIRWQYEKGCKDAGEMDRKSFRRMKKATNIQIKLERFL